MCLPQPAGGNRARVLENDSCASRGEAMDRQWGRADLNQRNFGPAPTVNGPNLISDPQRDLAFAVIPHDFCHLAFEVWVDGHCRLSHGEARR